ncbi:DUF1566 domain-containing protein [Pseudomonas sp. ML96]|uniref:DUF1566 domain-containing protein n=1 Tax=Pseudomonas sp. ML96 TaxID=1523503 RepID=UPI0005BDDEC6|nr:DUF1566 domain-containing protein [Pseudomonas sp. ML96]
MQTIRRNEVPALGQPLAGGTLIARYWQGEKEIALIALGADAEFEGKWAPDYEQVATTHGDGYSNTLAMAEAGSAIAAKVLELDAHIPSAFEAHVMMVAKQTGYLTDLREDRFYWTSSQYSAYSAFSMDFEGGWQYYDGKGNERLVRPVRSLIVQ